ncbi:MAG: hypothetical protein JSW47_14690 [Phycisphaerales bacterium]|nr:MAG: hypothetical protein JSW47_14690 [Phycisphaerales bacterium]
MFLKTAFLVLSALMMSLSSAHAQRPATKNRENPVVDPGRPGPVRSAGSALESGQLSSVSVSRKFYELAYELAGNRDVTGPDLQQAITFLTAALELDGKARTARSFLIELACRDPQRGHARLVYDLLVDYVDESADLDLAGKAIAYLLERMNSREEREKLLEQLIVDLGTSNPVLNSRIATILGTLKAEKTDTKAAEFYFLEAYKANRYNQAAFEGLVKVAPEQITPAVWLERLRLALRENPSDIEAAIAFAAHAERLELYEIAAAGYEYCAELFRYLYESEAIPARIYLPWAISAYNTRSDQSKCLHIARRVRQEIGFDLRLEAIAGKAAVKIGDVELAEKIFQNAEEKAKQLLAPRNSPTQAAGTETSDGGDTRQTYLEQLAWFYCFALPIPKKAVPPANEAWSNDPNSPVARSLLAYALAINGDTEFARPLVNNKLYERNQIAELTQAIIQLAEGKTDQAIETLKATIARDPGSFAAEQAKELLAEKGRRYVPPVDPNAVLNSLENAFGLTLTPVFTPPEKIISAQLDLQGDTLGYGTEFSGVVAITNNSAESFVISDRGLLKGNIRIDAEVTGDLNKKVPNLLFTRNRTTFLAAPGRSVLIPVRLMTGELAHTLLRHPQASVDIEFTLYLDPVVTESGTIANRLTYIEPAQTRIRRPGARITARNLTDRFKTIATDRVEKKIETARLFTGLLKEQQEYRNDRIPYRFMYADWVTPMLRDALLKESGLLRNPAGTEWIVKVHTMAEMLSLPLDFELTSAVAESLYDAKWPVRMMAVYLLAKSMDNRFGNVLDSIGENDLSKSVRDMALALSKAPAS